MIVSQHFAEAPWMKLTLTSVVDSSVISLNVCHQRYSCNQVMYSITASLILVFGLTRFMDGCQGNSCPRTNSDPNRNCAVRECEPTTGCYRKKDVCLCDGDCGYSCIKKTLKCSTPLPRQLANGRRSVPNGMKFNSTAIFTCKRGFTLSGSSIRTCRGNGDWDGSRARCRKYCSDPGIGQFSRRYESVKKSGFKTKTALHYYCLPNYQLQGKSTIICKPNGQWTHPIPKCVEIQCTPPTLPANSKISRPKSYDVNNGGKYGTSLLLGCNYGYYRTGQIGLMRCMEGGVWNTTKGFKCTPRSCGDPGVPKNGERQGLLFHFKSNVTFSCHKCYKLVGPSYRICNANKKWSDQQPVCERVQCERLKDLGNGSTTPTSTDCGAKVVYSCNKGYNIFGPRERICNETGQWTGEEPNCTIITCGRPKGLNSKGLTYNASGFHYGSTIQFTCNTSYKIDGDNFMKCSENGTWSHAVPKCLAPCNPPPTVLSKKRIFLHGETGRSTQFTCESGKTIHGFVHHGEAAKCQDGTWTVKFYCKKSQIKKLWGTK